MARYRVTCTLKHEKNERIVSLGCYSPANIYYTFTETEVIDRLENQTDSFYVERPTGHVVDLIVAEREGRKYVKTEADGEKPDNLLSLSNCLAKPHHVPTAGRVVIPAASHGASTAGERRR